MSDNLDILVHEIIDIFTDFTGYPRIHISPTVAVEIREGIEDYLKSCNPYQEYIDWARRHSKDLDRRFKKAVDNLPTRVNRRA